MNTVALIGRLTRDPEARIINTNEKQIEVTRFTLAINRTSNKEQADFIPCKAFGKTAEVINKYVHQGSRIAVKGNIQSGSYTNKDGQKIYTLDVLAESIEFLDSKRNEDFQSDEVEKGEGFINVSEDDELDELPFK